MKIVRKDDMPKLVTYEDLYIHLRQKTEDKFLQSLLDIISDLEGLKFKEFWAMIETPIPYVFKYKNRYIITRDKSKIMVGDNVKKQETPKLNFVKVDAIPEKQSKGAEKWQEIVKQIPDGSAIVFSEDEMKPSTVKAGINRLNKTSDVQYAITTRTKEGKVQTYVYKVEA